MRDATVPDQPPSVLRRRYGLGARWFHWVTALLVFTVIPLGWIFGAFKTKPGAPDTFVAPFPGTPADHASAHMTVGLVLFPIIALRVLYRFRHSPPRLPGTMGAFEKGLAHLMHWLLYAVLIAMPVSGYIMSSGDKAPIRFLGLIDFPKVPTTPGQGMTAAIVHVYAQFAVYTLVILNLAGTAWHLFVRRDNILGRMLPRQSNHD
ncbi:cytochrome b [Beijerinckia sp. L45]|uniref:cytochrome b n=1 Tax=Beijerinckia sp. L45 TaxID=1641855 RepID=UPI00131E554F|nr:cytochrome b [Beijerinckia sp. L45]